VFAQLEALKSKTDASVAARLYIGIDGDTYWGTNLARGNTPMSIAWPEWDEIRLDMIEIEYAGDRGWEGVEYRVHETTGFFAFWCRDFEVSD